MRILLTGKDGQVGWELERSLRSLGELHAVGRAELDLSSPDQIEARVDEVRPDVIVNAGAYTAVDAAEADLDGAMRVNRDGPRILAQEAHRLGALLVHYSTDYVFDGTKSRPYVEDDPHNPLNVYGKSKAEGEYAIQTTGCRFLIFRTSWIYGARGKNFLLTMKRLASEKSVIRVVSDQIGAPTWCRHVAEATAIAIQRARSAGPHGVYHMTASGFASWHGFARRILEALGYQGEIVAITSDDYPVAARRPKNSRLDCTKLARALGITLPSWEGAVDECLESTLG